MVFCNIQYQQTKILIYLLKPTRLMPLNSGLVAYQSVRKHIFYHTPLLITYGTDVFMYGTFLNLCVIFYTTFFCKTKENTVILSNRMSFYTFAIFSVKQNIQGCANRHGHGSTVTLENKCNSIGYYTEIKYTRSTVLAQHNAITLLISNRNNSDTSSIRFITYYFLI